MPRSELYFARATYVPRTCDVLVTFPWCIREVSLFVWNFTLYVRRIKAYVHVRVTYVWRIKGTRDVS